MSLTTDRLDLRPYDNDDFDSYHATRSSDAATRFLLHGPMDVAEARRSFEIVAEARTFDRRGDELVLAVVRRDDRVIVGDIFLGWIDSPDLTAEIGFVFDPTHRGNGYAQEAGHAVLDFTFCRRRLHRVIGRCHVDNVRSMRLMERLGMRREAHFVRSTMVKGAWEDEVVYACLDDER